MPAGCQQKPPRQGHYRRAVAEGLASRERLCENERRPPALARPLPGPGAGPTPRERQWMPRPPSWSSWRQAGAIPPSTPRPARRNERPWPSSMPRCGRAGPTPSTSMRRATYISKGGGRVKALSGRHVPLPPGHQTPCDEHRLQSSPDRNAGGWSGGRGRAGPPYHRSRTSPQETERGCPPMKSLLIRLPPL